MGGDSDEIVADDEVVLRLTWSPVDFDDAGELLPQTFRTEDFSGPEDGVSVDREKLCSEQAVRSRAEVQRPKKPEGRKQAHLSSCAVKKIRSESEKIKRQSECAETVTNEFVFDVISSPLPDNPAHAHIASRRKRTKSQRKEARLRLVRLFSQHLELDRYFQSK